MPNIHLAEPKKINPSVKSEFR